MTVTDLIEFLLARIAEDERHATAAADRIPLIYSEAALRDKGIGIAQAGHIARHDPARVLAECEAKRRVVESCRVDYEDSLTSGDDGTTLAEEVLHALALPYAGHPDYRQEWRIR